MPSEYDLKLREKLTQRLHFALTQRGATGMCIDETDGSGMTWKHEYHAQPRRVVHTTTTATWEHVFAEVTYKDVARAVDRICNLTKYAPKKHVKSGISKEK